MKVLAIGPHPDDIEIGCGGTLLKLRAGGAEIVKLVMTRGEVGGAPKTRAREEQASAKRMGAKILWGGFRDTRIQSNRISINKVGGVISQVNPELVLVNFRDDTHQDHRQTAQIVMSATRHLHNVLFYEVPTTLNFIPTIFMDIGEVLVQKLDLLKAHQSQIQETKVRGLSILDSAQACAVFRGFQDRVKFAEGFVPLRFSLDSWLVR